MFKFPMFPNEQFVNVGIETGRVGDVHFTIAVEVDVFSEFLDNSCSTCVAANTRSSSLSFWTSCRSCIRSKSGTPSLICGT